MEAAFVRDVIPEEADVKLDKPRVEKVVENSVGDPERKMLADISNVPKKPSVLTQDNKSRPTSSTGKEYVEQLQKENAALKKLVADKNKIIELSGAELHQLGLTLQKMQQQNLHLAQANSQMLAELNSGKDRVFYFTFLFLICL
ncbi:shugoshin-1-like isoform X2 [Bidens hawaiensis]|uniref:shugoshin-1-like isoform X2 n=1 Tax=Bidens hawaiensis TaxID=980011 RepID=UPI0040496AC0